MRALAPDPARPLPDHAGAAAGARGVRAQRGPGAVDGRAGRRSCSELFADELAAWHAAQRAGKSLGEHLAARPAATPPADPEERTATDAFGPTRLRRQARFRWGQAAAMTVVLALSAVVGGFVAKRWSGGSVAPVRAAAASAAPALPAAPAPPVTPTTASYDARATVPIVPAVAARAVVAPEPAGAPAKARSRARARAAVSAPESAPHPTPESRLKAWDPDSPVPP